MKWKTPPYRNHIHLSGENTLFSVLPISTKILATEGGFLDETCS
jgi:hypothetical protein